MISTIFASVKKNIQQKESQIISISIKSLYPQKKIVSTFDNNLQMTMRKKNEKVRGKGF